MNHSQQERMLAGYDQAMGEAVQRAYYGYSDFYNYGYWADGATSQKEASEALVERILSFIPEKMGNILDVACGLGATTRQVINYYEPENVTGINLSEVQLEKARHNAPGAQFLYMDAVHLQFPEASFDNVICVESAHHFKTRDIFYKQAFRVLKPGGRLVTSDIGGGPKWLWQANHLRDGEDLQKHLEDAGFDDVQVQDVTEDTWGGFCRNLRRWPSEARRRGEIDRKQFVFVWIYARLYPPVTGIGVKKYFLTSARKPLPAEAEIYLQDPTPGAGDEPEGTPEVKQ